MKYLKQFNENITQGPKRGESLLGLIKELDNCKITPSVDKVPMYKQYKSIIVKTETPIDTTGFEHVVEVAGLEHNLLTGEKFGPGYTTNWLYISTSQEGIRLTFYPDYQNINNRVEQIYDSSIEDHPIIGNNDINYQEIENILNKWGIDVDDMWGIRYDW